MLRYHLEELLADFYLERFLDSIYRIAGKEND
jgi:hypothetical protein